MNDDCNTTIKETFQEPRKRFWLRSRKRPKSDAMSISSMDISIDSDVGKKKKRRRITEVASSIFSSSNTVNKLGNTLHRSFTVQPNSSDLSIIEDEVDNEILHKRLKNTTENCNSFTIKSWVLDVQSHAKDHLSNILSQSEVKRQEAIYELYCGENVLLNDLCILRDFYYEPMLSTGIFTSEELFILFGDITSLIEIHTSLRDKLFQLRDRFGFTKSLGPTIHDWLSTLEKPYMDRCRTLVWARHLLDEKRFNNKKFQSFLKKRLESPHSLDLWTYLDIPRSRIVKYPLLMKEILKHTLTTDADYLPLKNASGILSELLKNIDHIMGDAECKYAQSRINAKVEHDPEKHIANATELITEGQLKDVRGIKYYCFLFDTCFAITRPTRRKKYSLSFSVVPREQICIENKNVTETGFKIREHFFITEDGHKRRHWIDSFNKLYARIGILDKVSNTHEKENLLNTKLSESNRVTRLSMSTKTSTSSINDNNFSSSVRKSPLKQKSNSIDYT